MIEKTRNKSEASAERGIPFQSVKLIILCENVQMTELGSEKTLQHLIK